jgi:hypothetical protein
MLSPMRKGSLIRSLTRKETKNPMKKENRDPTRKGTMTRGPMKRGNRGPMRKGTMTRSPKRKGTMTKSQGTRITNKIKMEEKDTIQRNTTTRMGRKDLLSPTTRTTIEITTEIQINALSQEIERIGPSSRGQNM